MAVKQDWPEVERGPKRLESLRNLIEQVDRLPETVGLSVVVMEWLNEVREFREEELNFLEAGENFKTDPDDYRANLSHLIAQGESLLYGAKKWGLLADIRVKVDDISATVELLRLTLRGVQGPHAHPETGKAIENLFVAA